MFRIALTTLINHFVPEPILNAYKRNEKMSKEIEKFHELLGDDAKIAKIFII